MSETIGFVGVGTMGGPMAGNLQRAGKRVIVHDIRREAAEGLCEGGAEWVDDFRALRDRTDLVVTSLPGPKEIEQVAFGANGHPPIPPQLASMTSTPASTAAATFASPAPRVSWKCRRK